MFIIDRAIITRLLKHVNLSWFYRITIIFPLTQISFWLSRGSFIYFILSFESRRYMDVCLLWVLCVVR